LRVFWKGRVVEAKSQPQTIVVSVESIFTSLKRPGCRARAQRPCRHAVYFTGCNLNRALFQSAGTVSAVDGLVLTIAEAALAPAGDFKAGIVDWGGLLGWVRAHSGSQVTLTAPIPGLADAVAADGSAAVTLAPGCDQSNSRCHNRFGNILNNGGFNWMTSKNPFSSSIV